MQQAAYVNPKILSKHVFIAGVTGGGKSNTSQLLLERSKLPFIVIEPTKTEYRALINRKELLFSLGEEKFAPLRFNPLELLPNESICSRVDLIRNSFEATMDMEAAIPQILEDALYHCYQKFGWDIESDENIYADKKDSYGLGGLYFPTLKDVLDAIPTVIEKAEFSERLKGDYLGSIRARLQTFLVGSKGLMLVKARGAGLFPKQFV